MLLQVEEIHREEDGRKTRVLMLCHPCLLPRLRPSPTATHTTAPSWAMRGKLQGGKDGQENNKEPSPSLVADTDQNTAHFRQSGASTGEKQCVLWNACTKHHAGKRGAARKEVGV